MPEEYQICSICAKVGHTYSSCKENKEKCINCQGKHRTLAARCPERRKIIKDKLRERRKQSTTRKEITKNVVVEEIHRIKLPENYLAVMAVAITIAEKREMEIPGVYIYVPWPFPPSWGVADNTKKATKTMGFYSVLLAVTRDPAEFGWHCWSNTAHPPPLFHNLRRFTDAITPIAPTTGLPI